MRDGRWIGSRKDGCHVGNGGFCSMRPVEGGEEAEIEDESW